jgi:N-acetylglucosamine-6-phosphate deacetylase
MTVIQGSILTPSGFVEGRLVLDGGRVAAIEGRPVDEPTARRAGQLLLPGFIDLHVHGGGEAVATLARLHARHGTTALLATTMTAPMGDIEAALHALAPHCVQRAAGAARVLGVHLEGPYISAARLGAQPAFARPPALDEILALHAIAPIRLVTIAPEVAGSLALIPHLVEAGMRVQIGHSDASYEQAVAALM